MHPHRRSLVALLLGGLALAGVAGCKSSESNQAELQLLEFPPELSGRADSSHCVLVPKVRGKAFFIDKGEEGDPERRVRLFVEGRHAWIGCGGSTGTIDRVEIRGAPGYVGVYELVTDDSHLIHTLHGVHGRWSLAPKDIESPIEWEGDAPAYTLLVRYVYAGGHQTADLLARFHGIVQSPLVPLVLATSEGEGDEITALVATGTFSSSQGLALYDIEVAWNGEGKKLELFAAPQNASNFPAQHHRIHDASLEGASGTYQASGIPGRYNGADTYLFAVRVTFKEGEQDTWSGTFTNIQALQGTPIALDW